ncbi:MAG TPA: vanadium-dependent haloperoxidase [Ktedonobacteraceae bacterium]|nr:vanadium-dependent haloperoxidase [Ktedonobacteraceae bacterium]
MAKQDEQKRKGGQVARHGRPVASVPARSSAARTKTTTKPLPVLEAGSGNEPTDKLVSTDSPTLVPETIRRRQFLIAGAGLAATTLALGGCLWLMAPHPASSPQQPTFTAASGDQLVVYWNKATLAVLRDLQTPLPVAARTLSIVHTSMFDAWAAYDPTAQGTRLGASIRQPASERTLANQCQAISYAAYHALLDLFPSEQARFQHLMTSLRYNPSDHNTSTRAPAGIGNLAAQAVLDFRRNDGSNQLGAYADYTNYQPLNTPSNIKRPNHWQPLSMPVGQTGMKVQQFACAHWANVTPFALASALQFVPRPGPPRYPDSQYTSQAQQVLQYSAGLNDLQKVIAEYWATTTGAQILARWFTFAQFISQRDNHTLDQNIKLFFSLANAELDTSIACWASKRAYDSAYPVTAIHYLFKDKQIRAWAGPGKFIQWFDGQYWLPYQPTGALSPAYPEYCSEQSAFSAAAAVILRHATGSDTLGTTYTQPARSSLIEPGTPINPIKLSWKTLSQAANEAGMAGRYAGTHFSQSDLDGRVLGSRVAEQVWHKAQSYINGKPVL